MRPRSRPRARRCSSSIATTFANNHLDAIVFPTVPKVAIAANPDASSVPNFVLYIQNTDPGSNAGVPGLQIPIALGATSKLPVGMELDGPSGSDRRLLSIGLALEKLSGEFRRRRNCSARLSVSWSHPSRRC